MRRYESALGIAMCAGLLSGCVERRYVIYSDPPGAIVLRNGRPIGATPVDDHFDYYGKYDFTIMKDGYETLQVQQEIPAPWYEWIGIDFFSENVMPFQVEDVRQFHYKLEPRKVVNTNELMHDAQNLRNRGLSLGPESVGRQPRVAESTVPAPPPATIAPP